MGNIKKNCIYLLKCVPHPPGFRCLQALLILSSFSLYEITLRDDINITWFFVTTFFFAGSKFCASSLYILVLRVPFPKVRGSPLFRFNLSSEICPFPSQACHCHNSDGSNFDVYRRRSIKLKNYVILSFIT